MAIGRGTWASAHLAWVDSSTSDLRSGTAAEYFGEQQRRRLAALSASAAQRFIVGRELLAIVLAEIAVEIPDASAREGVTLTASCGQCGGEHGALRVLGLPVVVSVSYAGSMVAVAAARLDNAAAIGVDIERAPSDDVDAPLQSLAALFAPAPPPSTSQWTMLEAALKADGRGIAVDVAQCRILEDARGTAVSIPNRDHPVRVATLAGPPGFVLSVAAIAPRPSEPAH